MLRKSIFFKFTASILFFLFILLPLNLFATSFVGFTNLLGSGGWVNPDSYTTGDLQIDLFFTVELDEATAFWTYTYEIGLDNEQLNHFIIETSSVFTSNNIKVGTTDGYSGPTTYISDSNNPGLPSNIFGLQWDLVVENEDPPSGFDTFDYNYKYILISDKAPTWGNVYIQDGYDDFQGAGMTYAYNLGWSDPRTGIYANFDPENPPTSTLEGFNFTLVPDSGTPTVPEPVTILLFGAGLLGIAGVSRQKK